MPRKERERRYISEYMKETWPEGDWQLNVPLAMLPQEYADRYGMGKAAAFFRSWHPRVDAVKWLPDRYYLIEAKIRDVKTGIGDLLYYRSIIDKTTDLPFYEGQPVICRLVCPWSYDWIADIARTNNIEIVVRNYPWIAEYVKERQHYFTTEYRDARAEKMRLRQILDVE